MSANKTTSQTGAASAASPTQDLPKTVKVKLAKPHTHAGRDYLAGVELEVDESTAKWLRDQKVVEQAAEASTSQD